MPCHVTCACLLLCNVLGVMYASREDDICSCWARVHVRLSMAAFVAVWLFMAATWLSGFAFPASLHKYPPGIVVGTSSPSGIALGVAVVLVPVVFAVTIWFPPHTLQALLWILRRPQELR